MFAFNDTTLNIGIGENYYISDIKEGPAIVASSGVAIVDVDLTYDDTTQVGVGTVVIRKNDVNLTLVLGDDDEIMEWVPTTQEATLDEFRYIHKFFVHVGPTSFGPPIIQCSIWTETPTRRKTWRREGSGIFADETLPPTKRLREISTANPRADQNVATKMYSGESSRTGRLLPAYTGLTDDILDGSFFKLTRPEYPYQGLYILRRRPSGSGGIDDAYCVLDASDATFDFPNTYEVSFGYYVFQLERQFDTEGVPTGHWKIYVNNQHGYLGTPRLTSSNSDKLYVMSQSSDDIVESQAWNVENTLWDITIDESKRTIQFENVDLKAAGEPNRFWGENLSGRNASPFTQMRDAANASSFVFDILFIPKQYEQNRYELSDQLTIQCCRDNVTEIGIPPIGFGEQINYEIFCPAEFAPTNLNPPSSTGFVLPQTTAACETFITSFCADSETKDDLACSCINLTDLPLLPDNATITTYELCFSNNCRNYGYIPLAQQDINGGLSCPLTTLCDILDDEEEKDGDIYNDAQVILGCSGSSPDPDPEPEPEGLSILWISVIAVGGVLFLGLIIGLAVGLPAAERSSKKKKEEEELQKDLKLQQELFQLQNLRSKYLSR